MKTDPVTPILQNNYSLFFSFFIILIEIVCFHYCVNVESHLGCVISSFHQGVGEIFVLLRCYAAYIGSC